jgi:DNA-directed RNA polymerase subunit M/transcription elongation factor TFIIS
MDNTLVRSAPCPKCGGEMLWTQNAWPADAPVTAGYRCLNGHVLDPTMTRQCPACGLHDTERLAAEEPQQFRCLSCGAVFKFPR